MQSIVDALIANLTEFKAHSADLDEVKAEHAQATTDLATTKDSLDSTKAELISAQSGLSSVQVANLKRYNEDIFNKNKEVESLNTSIKTARAQLDTLNVDIKSAEAHHQQIADSIDSLRRKLG